MGAMNLLAYRPWTQKYWDTFVPKKAHGLLEMGPTQREYGLAYLPGEHRDPTGWHDWVMGGHIGQPPSGSWRFQPETYPKDAPWRFTTGQSGLADMRTNIYDTPWSAASMNLTPAQGAKWQGLLSGIGSTPKIDTTATSLLGV